MQNYKKFLVCKIILLKANINHVKIISKLNNNYKFAYVIIKITY